MPTPFSKGETWQVRDEISNPFLLLVYYDISRKCLVKCHIWCILWVCVFLSLSKVWTAGDTKRDELSLLKWFTRPISCVECAHFSMHWRILVYLRWLPILPNKVLSVRPTLLLLLCYTVLQHYGRFFFVSSFWSSNGEIFGHYWHCAFARVLQARAEFQNGYWCRVIFQEWWQ